MSSQLNHPEPTFLQHLITLENNKFTGKLVVNSIEHSQCSLYFLRGRLIWVDSSYHPYRSWQRHLKKYCFSAQLSANEIEEADQFECWDYYILTILLKRNLVKREQVKILIESRTTEIFFDILQQENVGRNQYQWQPKSANFLLESGLKVPITFIDIKTCSNQAQLNWLEWCKQGLQKWSPNLAPIVLDQKRLEQEVPKLVYQNFIQVLNNQHSLRDLALQMNQDLCKLSYSLSIYVYKGLLEFSEIADLPDKNQPLQPIISLTKTNYSLPRKQLLIACIDDSPQVYHMMKYILTKANYQVMGIENALDAIPQLITNKPDFIFLDIGMPIMNGYEICSQIRRTSKLKDIPVVMLTSNDGIVDRVQAKSVGASGFLTKPINAQKIIHTIQNFSESNFLK